MVQFVWLTTDCLLWALIVCLLFYVRHVRHTPPLIVTWRKVFARPVAMSMSVILLLAEKETHSMLSVAQKEPEPAVKSAQASHLFSAAPKPARPPSLSSNGYLPSDGEIPF